MSWMCTTLAGKGDPAGQCFAAGRKSAAPQDGVISRVERARGDVAEQVTLADHQGGHIAVAEPLPGLDQGRAPAADQTPNGP